MKYTSTVPQNNQPLDNKLKLTQGWRKESFKPGIIENSVQFHPKIFCAKQARLEANEIAGQNMTHILFFYSNSILKSTRPINNKYCHM